MEAHSKKNAGCGHTGQGKKKRAVKPERDMRDEAGTGQHNKQGSTEEWDQQLHRSATSDEGTRRGRKRERGRDSARIRGRERTGRIGREGERYKIQDTRNFI